MAKEPKTRNILITFDIASIAGRDQLAGVLRYLRGKPNWIPRLVSRAADFTPEIVLNATAEKIDGIIINHAGSPATEDALARSDIPFPSSSANPPRESPRPRDSSSRRCATSRKTPPRASPPATSRRSSASPRAS